MKASDKSKIVIAVITGALVSLMFSTLLLGLAAIIISNGKLSVSSEVVITVGIHFLSAFVGTITSGVISNRKWIACICTLTVTLLITIFVNVIAYNGEFYNIAACIFADVIGLSASLMLLMFTKNQKNKSIKKYRPR